MRVYIACPYGDHNPLAVREANVARADAAARELALLGHVPVCTIRLTHRWNEDPRLSLKHWWAIDTSLIREWAEVIFRLPGESPGADKECEMAIALGLPICYSYDELFALTGSPGADTGRLGVNHLDVSEASFLVLTGDLDVGVARVEIRVWP